ncbi:MAG: iclR [Hyphomicrobiales bacterium]|nr:iclR [Hyphomicrobiales bacterium]
MREGQKGIQSVEHGLKLLEALIEAREARPLKWLAAAADMSPSMAHRYLTSFVRGGVVQQDAASGHYDLGPLALRLGMAALNRTDLIAIADEEFSQLVRRVNVDGHLSIWGDYGVTIVRIHNRPAPLLSNLRLGGILPLYESAAGQVFLAWQDRASVEPVLGAELARMEGPAPTPADIEAQRASVRERGFAWIDGQVFHGIRAVAAPVFDPQGVLRASMSLVANQPSLVRFPNAIVTDLVETAARTSRRLGWSG